MDLPAITMFTATSCQLSQLFGTEKQHDIETVSPIKNGELPAITMFVFLGVRSVGPVGDFLEDIESLLRFACSMLRKSSKHILPNACETWC